VSLRENEGIWLKSKPVLTLVKGSTKGGKKENKRRKNAGVFTSSCECSTSAKKGEDSGENAKPQPSSRSNASSTHQGRDKINNRLILRSRKKKAKKRTPSAKGKVVPLRLRVRRLE